MFYIDELDDGCWYVDKYSEELEGRLNIVGVINDSINDCWVKYIGFFVCNGVKCIESGFGIWWNKFFK